MRLLAVAIVAVAGLAACQTKDERQTAQCAGYGFQAGTQQFAQCKMAVDMRERQEWMDLDRRLAAEQLAREQIQAQRDAANSQSLSDSFSRGRQATACGWEGQQWVCRPSW